MTVRGIFYALVSKGVVPKDENRGYRPVQRNVLELRRAGELPWEFISDSTRWRRKPETFDFDSHEDALRATARAYRRNLWRDQERAYRGLAREGRARRGCREDDLRLGCPADGQSGRLVRDISARSRHGGQCGLGDVIRGDGDRDVVRLRRGRRESRTSDQDTFENHARTSSSPTSPLPSRRSASGTCRRGPRRRPIRRPRHGERSPSNSTRSLPTSLRSLIEGEITNRIEPRAWNLARQYEAEERKTLPAHREKGRRMIGLELSSRAGSRPAPPSSRSSPPSSATVCCSWPCPAAASSGRGLEPHCRGPGCSPRKAAGGVTAGGRPGPVTRPVAAGKEWTSGITPAPRRRRKACTTPPRGQQATAAWVARGEEAWAALGRMHDAALVFTAEWERDSADTSDEPNFEQWERTTAAVDGLVAAARDAQDARVEHWRANVRLSNTL